MERPNKIRSETAGDCPAPGETFEIFTFAMPGEERFFFRYLHGIALAAYLLVFTLATRGGSAAAGPALEAALIVGPFYAVVLFYRKRFAERVVLDFAARRVYFHFPGERGRVEKDFSAVQSVKFQYYLTFMVGDFRAMVKRPRDKKNTFRLLRSAFHVNQGGGVG